MIVPYDFPLNLGGHKSKQFSPADIRNMFLVKSESNGRVAWSDFPGLKPRASGAGKDRGDHIMSGVRYVINGNTLYSEDSGGTRTSIGTISGSDRAIFADNGTDLGIVANKTIYHYDGSTLTTISQSVVTNPAWILHTNRTFVIGGDNSRFATSDVDDITTWNALNFARTEAIGDSLVRGYWFNDINYLFGTESCETWDYTGAGNPPLDKRDNALINIGIAGKYAICNTDRFLYFLADDRKAMQCIGASSRPIDTSAVSHIIDGYASVSDCILSSFRLDGQQFVLFKFPSSGDALVYSEDNNYWFTLSAGTNKNARESWYGNSVSQCYEKNLVTDYNSGDTYELDDDTATDNGDTRLRFMIGNPITGKMIGSPQNQVTVSTFHIPMQTGVGLVTSQGSDPVIMCEWSKDGGEVYGSENFVSIGVLGNYSKKVTFDFFSTGYELVPRIMCSDPVPITFYSGGSVELYDAGY